MTQSGRVFILLGAPGAGKGTQAQRIAETYNLFHIDTGHCLRSEIASGSELGKQAKSYMDQGQLVPFELVMQVIKASLLRIPQDKQGVLFDGFPRNQQQAYGLDQVLEELQIRIQAVLYLDISHSVLMDRLAYRVTCSRCDAKYNLKLNPPKQDAICDACGGELIIRPDDRPEVIENRLKTYASETEPLIRHYEERSLLRRIDANQPIDQVFEEIRHQISPFFHSSDTMLV